MYKLPVFKLFLSVGISSQNKSGFQAKTQANIFSIELPPRSFMPPLTEAASEDGDPSRPLGDVTLLAIKDQRAFSFDVDACNMWFKFLLFKYLAL